VEAAIAKGKAMSRTIEFSSRLAPARFSASLEHCEKHVNVLLGRKKLSLPSRARANIQRLLHFTYPVTLPAARLSSDALAYLLWETSWRGMSTVQQTSVPALHVQTLTVKWWTSLPEWLRFGSAAHLLRVLSSCVGSLFRSWQCVVERMKPYEFYFLDPRLVSIDCRRANMVGSC
jgi:hypothetical protein